MFTSFGNDATMLDVIRARRNDIAVINSLEKRKYNGRNVTDLRATPTAYDDIRAGDLEGDELISGAHYYKVMVINNTLQWVQINANTSF